MQEQYALRVRARILLRQPSMRFPNTSQTTAPILQHQKPQCLAACCPRAAKTWLHSRATRRAHHLTHSVCKCTRTYDFKERDFRERTISIFKFKPFKSVDQFASRISIRSTKAAADLTTLSGLITTRTVGVLSMVRWKRNHDANGMDRTCDKGRSVRSITTRPKPPP